MSNISDNQILLFEKILELAKINIMPPIIKTVFRATLSSFFLIIPFYFFWYRSTGQTGLHNPMIDEIVGYCKM